MADNQFPRVPLSIPDTSQHLRLVSTSLNNTRSMVNLNSTGTITLTASATSSTLTDARISGNSVILFMPTTANGRTALNTLHVSARASGSATLTHASSGNTDQTFYHIVSLDNLVTRVPSEDVEFIWRQTSPLLIKALDETYNIEDIYEGLIDDRMQLFISWNNDRVESAIVTEIAKYPQSKVLRYFWLVDLNLIIG